MKVTSVKVRRVATTGREYDAITVVIGDLHMRCDVTCARDIRLAKRLAEEHDAPYECEPAVWERFPGGKELSKTDYPLRVTCTGLEGNPRAYEVSRNGVHVAWFEFKDDAEAFTSKHRDNGAN